MKTVIYTGASDVQVRWGGRDDPRGILEIGKEYTVTDTEVHSWHTKITLDGFPDKQFNSVCFDYKT
jgi:hypothetical protein